MSGPFPRALSSVEFKLSDWFLEHSTRLLKYKKKKIRSRVAEALSIFKSRGGCATIEFSVAGRNPAFGSLHRLSESATRNNELGIVIYETDGVSSSLEIFGLANLELPSEFAPISLIKIR